MRETSAASKSNLYFWCLHSFESTREILY